MNEYRASKFRFVEDKIVANTIYVIFLFLVSVYMVTFILDKRLNIWFGNELEKIEN